MRGREHNYSEGIAAAVGGGTAVGEVGMKHTAEGREQRTVWVAADSWVGSDRPPAGHRTPHTAAVRHMLGPADSSSSHCGLAGVYGLGEDRSVMEVVADGSAAAHQHSARRPHHLSAAA